MMSNRQDSEPAVASPPDVKDAKDSPCRGKDIGDFLFNSQPTMTSDDEGEEKKEEITDTRAFPTKASDQGTTRKKKNSQKTKPEVITVAVGVEPVKLSELRNYARAESFDGCDDAVNSGFEEDVMRIDNTSEVVARSPFDLTEKFSSSKENVGRSRSEGRTRAIKHTKTATQANQSNRTFWLYLGGLMVASFLSTSPTTTRMVDSFCGPVSHGTFLGPSDSSQSFVAPWIVPTALKSDLLHNLLCWDRPRMKLDWMLQKQTRKQRLYQVVLSELKPNEEPTQVSNMEDVISATVIEWGILAEDRKGRDHVLPAPWQAFAL